MWSASCSSLRARLGRTHDRDGSYPFTASAAARAEIVERITHNAAGAMIDAYTYFGWDVLCDELSKLRVSRKSGSSYRSEKSRTVTRVVT